MNILLFEWFVGGGMLADQATARHLLNEGKAMRDAIATDIATLGHQVVTLQDIRLPIQSIENVTYRAIDELSDIQTTLCEVAEQVDKVLIIAPETGGCLLEVIDWIDQWAEKIVSPNREFVRVASDKMLTRHYMNENGVSVPKGELVGNWKNFDFENFPLPFVIKPTDGCGSEGIQFFGDYNSAARPNGKPGLIEQFVAGVPASVSVVAQNKSIHCLPPVQQLFNQFPIGEFADCHYPLSADLQRRATKLAMQAVAAMPESDGFFGIDIILADNGESDDVVIEVNPRFVSSYLRLREICQFSIVELMLA